MNYLSHFQFNDIVIFQKVRIHTAVKTTSYKLISVKPLIGTSCECLLEGDYFSVLIEEGKKLIRFY